MLEFVLVSVPLRLFFFFLYKHCLKSIETWETKDETVDFPLKEITENKVVFEGMSFERISDNEMNVYVDNNDNGKTEIV